MSGSLPEVDGVPIHAWLAPPVGSDVRAAIARLAKAPDVRHLAVMPDVHRAGEVCVGVALATGALVYPAAVGGDIGCGMAAVRFDVPAAVLTGDASLARAVLGSLGRAVPALKGLPDAVPERLDGAIDPALLSDERLARVARREGRWQLGTLGRGNHFLEFQADQQGGLWLMVHSGSRGMGQAITSWHLARAVAPGPAAMVALEADSAVGRGYLADVAWARAWARTNRAWMARAVAGQAGLVPGSMGTVSFHTVGRGHPESLRSSSHGAGRVLPRGEAARRIDARRLVREMHGVTFDARRAARLVDEAPTAYRDIRVVMRAQRDLTAVHRELRPLLSHKAM